VRNRWAYWRPVVEYLGLLTWLFGVMALVPLGVRVLAEQANLRKASKFLHRKA